MGHWLGIQFPVYVSRHLSSRFKYVNYLLAAGCRCVEAEVAPNAFLTLAPHPWRSQETGRELRVNPSCATGEGPGLLQPAGLRVLRRGCGY